MSRALVPLHAPVLRGLSQSGGQVGDLLDLLMGTISALLSALSPLKVGRLKGLAAGCPK